MFRLGGASGSRASFQGLGPGVFHGKGVFEYVCGEEGFVCFDGPLFSLVLRAFGLLRERVFQLWGCDSVGWIKWGSGCLDHVPFVVDDLLLKLFGPSASDFQFCGWGVDEFELLLLG